MAEIHFLVFNNACIRQSTRPTGLQSLTSDCRSSLPDKSLYLRKIPQKCLIYEPHSFHGKQFLKWHLSYDIHSSVSLGCTNWLNRYCFILSVLLKSVKSLFNYQSNRVTLFSLTQSLTVTILHQYFLNVQPECRCLMWRCWSWINMASLGAKIEFLHADTRILHLILAVIKI